MKKRNVLVLLLLCIAAAGFAEQVPSLSVGQGMDFFNYQEVFVSTGILVNIPIAADMEGILGADFGIWPYQESEGAEVTPHFFIPINAGIQFIFDKQKPIFYLGVGISPVFLADLEEVRFYMGPFLKGGLRVDVHPMMSWYIELQQDLSIGPPNWINTATRINTGVNFMFRAPDPGPDPDPDPDSAD